jgi:tetratricopeptide (TPR) repeat protein
VVGTNACLKKVFKLGTIAHDKSFFLCHYININQARKSQMFNLTFQTIQVETEVIVPTMIDYLDDYISMGIAYEEAYEYAMEDLERALKAERQADAEYVEPIEVAPLSDEAMAEDDKLFVKQAMVRGYSEQEARVLVAQARALTAKGEYEKAYRLYLSRLMG